MGDPKIKLAWAEEPLMPEVEWRSNTWEETSAQNQGKFAFFERNNLVS
jgi:hypothetical protein